MGGRIREVGEGENMGVDPFEGECGCVGWMTIIERGIERVDL